MKNIKTGIFLLICLVSLSASHGQNELRPEAGYTPQIGTMVAMLEDLKGRIEEMTRDLTQAETDYLFDADANSIGALIMHLAANEAYYQVQTLEGRAWTDEEAAFWMIAGEMNEKTREQLKGKPIEYYLELWNEVRIKTLEGLRAKDDAWFDANIEEGINNHYVWYHVMEHSANHMGQIALVKNRLPK
ncbi:DUF664 domain-containing protein [Robiginitalea aurantiaca]|uniref:DinB family protein n=1 Tax=Robiginitalea aurantiaca TaxID=3056915 RepID=A0ABT7WGS5_9FLAO|nr:DUF664 domain-containing protein [Robiginitalea aurantiaca]MDM9632120.1 DinB family protein [Robiginitalea aurantiaca]